MTMACIFGQILRPICPQDELLLVRMEFEAHIELDRIRPGSRSKRLNKCTSLSPSLRGLQKGTKAPFVNDVTPHRHTNCDP